MKKTAGNKKEKKVATKSTDKKDWANRITGYGTINPKQLKPNPNNWRVHPAMQKEILSKLLNKVGIVQNVIVNKRTGNIVDGHARVELALKEKQASVAVTYIDVSPEEELEILMSLDSVGMMAQADKNKIDELLKQCNDKDIMATLFPKVDIPLEEYQSVVQFTSEHDDGKFYQSEGAVTNDFTLLVVFEAEEQLKRVKHLLNAGKAGNHKTIGQIILESLEMTITTQPKPSEKKRTKK